MPGCLSYILASSAQALDHNKIESCMYNNMNTKLNFDHNSPSFSPVWFYLLHSRHA